VRDGLSIGSPATGFHFSAKSSKLPTIRGEEVVMRKLLVALFIVALLATTLLVQGASADKPHCTLGGCLGFDSEH